MDCPPHHYFSGFRNRDSMTYPICHISDMSWTLPKNLCQEVAKMFGATDQELNELAVIVAQSEVEHFELLKFHNF
jgi:hypothetical protein